jgi:hypothetical protein
MKYVSNAEFNEILEYLQAISYTCNSTDKDSRELLTNFFKEIKLMRDNSKYGKEDLF